MKLKHREVKRINKAIKDILLKDWDPIGVCGTSTDVDYDHFIWPIFSLVRRGADVDEVAAHLYMLEKDLMGSSPDNNERAMSASRKLITLKEKMSF